VSRNVPEQSWHKEAAELVERVAKLETALFPGAAVVTMDPASWAATAKSLDAHISKVEDALGLAPERQEQRELDREEEKAMAKVLKAIGYENSELSPQEKVALVRELMQEHKDLQKIGMHSTVAWESAAAEILDRKTAEPDVVAAPKTAAAVNTPERSKATPQRSKDREENYGRAWMHQQGGYDSLPEELKQSAEKSYKEWSERHPDKAESFGLNDYVAYTQDREGQRHEQEPVQSPKRNVADSSTRKQRLRSMKSFRGTTPAIARSRGGQQLDHEHSHCDRRNQLPPA
jgi:hypothetical protein